MQIPRDEIAERRERLEQQALEDSARALLVGAMARFHEEQESGAAGDAYQESVHALALIRTLMDLRATKDEG